MRYHINLNVLAYDFHHAQVVGGYGQHDNAVVVVVGRLHLRKVIFDTVIGVDGSVGKKDGVLDSAAPFIEEVFGDESSNLVAFDVVHDEE